MTLIFIFRKKYWFCYWEGVLLYIAWSENKGLLKFFNFKLLDFFFFCSSLLTSNYDLEKKLFFKWPHYLKDLIFFFCLLSVSVKCLETLLENYSCISVHNFYKEVKKKNKKIPCIFNQIAWILFLHNLLS